MGDRGREGRGEERGGEHKGGQGRDSEAHLSLLAGCGLPPPACWIRKAFSHFLFSFALGLRLPGKSWELASWNKVLSKLELARSALNCQDHTASSPTVRSWTLSWAEGGALLVGLASGVVSDCCGEGAPQTPCGFRQHRLGWGENGFSPSLVGINGRQRLG